jgi:hypothetical protein
MFGIDLDIEQKKNGQGTVFFAPLQFTFSNQLQIDLEQIIELERIFSGK